MTKRLDAPFGARRRAIAIASAAAVGSSSSDAFAISIPVRSLTIVWKLRSASRRPWEISGWYGVYAVYHDGSSSTLRWMTGGVTVPWYPRPISEGTTRLRSARPRRAAVVADSPSAAGSARGASDRIVVRHRSGGELVERRVAELRQHLRLIGGGGADVAIEKSIGRLEVCHRGLALGGLASG